MAKAKVTIHPPFIFNVYKPAGVGSSDVVRHFKYHLPTGFGKIGHLGTLDPFAEGVLLLSIAGASRLSNYLHETYPKTYEAIGRVGQFYDTGDTTGTPVSKPLESLPNLDLQSLNRVASIFYGDYLQAPPMYSATKHQGKPLYKYAREGVKIEKKPVERHIYSFKVQKIVENNIHFECTVSSGTYIRVLFEDFCKKLNISGALSNLKRTKIGPFGYKDSISEELWPKRGEQAFSKYIENWGRGAMCPGLDLCQKQHYLSPTEWFNFKNGMLIECSNEKSVEFSNSGPIGIFSPSGRVSALANYQDNTLVPFIRFSPFLD